MPNTTDKLLSSKAADKVDPGQVHGTQSQTLTGPHAYAT